MQELSGVRGGPRAAADALVAIKTKKMKSWAPPQHIRKEFGGVIRKIKEGVREIGANSQRFVDLATETERQLVAKARDALRENARLRRDMTKATTEAVDAQRAATEPVLETSTAELQST